MEIQDQEKTTQQQAIGNQDKQYLSTNQTTEIDIWNYILFFVKYFFKKSVIDKAKNLKKTNQFQK